MLQDTPCPEDQLLLERLVNDKDPRAFECLYTKYFPRLRCYAARRIGSGRDAEDLAQCVFVHLWETRARYERGGSVEVYLFSVANNAIAGYGRSRQRQCRDRAMRLTADESPWDDGPIDPAPTPRVSEMIADERIQISTKAREALRLRFIQGLSMEEASRAIGCSRTAFYARLERAVKALRGWVSQEQNR